MPGARSPSEERPAKNTIRRYTPSTFTRHPVQGGGTRFTVAAFARPFAMAVTVTVADSLRSAGAVYLPEVSSKVPISGLRIQVTRVEGVVSATFAGAAGGGGTCPCGFAAGDATGAPATCATNCSDCPAFKSTFAGITVTLS